MGGIKKTPQSKYLFYLAISTFLFFLIAVGIAYFVRFAGIDRTVSGEKIAIITQGQSSANAGEEVPLTIRIANRNPVTIQDVELTIRYPEGTYKKENETVRYITNEEWKHTDLPELQTIKTGKIVNVQIAPIMYGKTEEEKEIVYELQYRVEGVKEPQKIRESHTILLNSTPILISTPKYSSSIAGKETAVTITVQSNTEKILPKIYIQTIYPINFTATRFTPKPVIGTEENVDVWELSSLKPGEKKTIQVRGIIRGEEGEEQSIIARALVAPTEKFEEAVEVTKKDTIITVGKAFLNIALTMNNKKSDSIVVSPGEYVTTEILWSNRDQERLDNVTIIASLDGSGLDESSITVKDGGYFDEVRKQIIWDKDNTNSLRSVNANERGRLSFYFNALPNRIEFSQPKKYIRVSMSAQAKRLQTNTTEKVKEVDIGLVKVRSVLQAAANTLYATSEVRNTGPLPPQAGEETSYALKYFIKNNGNDLSDIELLIPLEHTARFTEATSGIALSEWEYNEENHTILVKIPSLAAAGPQSSRSMEFQVIVEPLPQDIGRYIQLTEKASYKARDIYVNEVFKGEIRGLTTEISAEPIRNTQVVAPEEE